VLSGQIQCDIAVTGTESSLKQMIRRSRFNSGDVKIILEPDLQIGEDLMYTARNTRFYQFGPNYRRDLQIS
jgi:hypothetical protein